MIRNAVIGPNVSIGAGSVIEKSSVRDSIVGARAMLKDCAVHDSMVGDGAVLVNVRGAVSIGDNGEVHGE